MSTLWPIRPLGDLISIKKGRKPAQLTTIPSASTLPYATADFFRSGIPKQFVNSDTTRSYVPIKIGNPVIIWDGSNAGEVFIGKKAILSSTMALLTVNETIIRPDFCYFFLKTEFSTLNKGTTGSTIPHVNKLTLAGLQIPTPTLTEQKLISEILFRVEQAISLQAAAIKTTCELKQSAMLELFTHGLHREAQKDTEIGPAPKRWTDTTLGDLFEIKHGFAFDGAFFAPHGEKILLTPGHFNEEGGFKDQGKKTKFYTGQIPAGYTLNEGDLLIAMTEQKKGLLGSSALIPHEKTFLHNQRLGLIINLQEQRLTKEYLYHLFNYSGLREAISKSASGSKVRHTSPNKVRAIKIALPPINEQTQIIKILGAINKKISLHKEKHAVLNELFKSLLHKLMTGTIRVSELNLSSLKSNETYS